MTGTPPQMQIRLAFQQGVSSRTQTGIKPECNCGLLIEREEYVRSGTVSKRSRSSSTTGSQQCEPLTTSRL